MASFGSLTLENNPFRHIFACFLSRISWILAFLALSNSRLRIAGQSLGKRMTFFADLRVLCRYNSFRDWQVLWLFMIESLDDDIPSKILALF
ncbi:MAG: hypothetical protein KDE56_14150 [Anaerolineales bacterium]|nr:hypothetical protein [Anaerolineales bacterium]